jgi:predicted ATP-dependent protease
MRDIRNDLQERARLIEEQISGAYAQFEKMVEQLQAEREGRVTDLKSELSAVVKLLEAEHRRMANVLPIANAQPAPQQNARDIGQPQPSLSEFILRKLNDIGPMSKDELINSALQDGVFADGDSAERAVHAALVSTLRNEQIRQLQDGTFAPVSLGQTVRFRRAI